jgi:hypothetical protein
MVAATAVKVKVKAKAKKQNNSLNPIDSLQARFGGLFLWSKHNKNPSPGWAKSVRFEIRDA